MAEGCRHYYPALQILLTLLVHLVGNIPVGKPPRIVPLPTNCIEPVQVLQRGDLARLAGCSCSG